MLEEDAEAMDAVEAEYEPWFGEGQDRRAPVAKLVDMRAWPKSGDEDENDADQQENPA